jgi:hypothetical protein
MILDLGSVGDFVQVTAQYSNAVLVAVLPYFSDVAKKVDLPVPQPITQTDVAGLHVLPFKEAKASILLKNGCVFDFQSGFVNRYINPDSVSYHSQAFDKTSEQNYKDRKIEKDEAVQIARITLKKLGIPLEDVFAEQEPRIAIEQKNDANASPHYHIQ